MARAGKFSSSLDVVVFGVCMALSIIAYVLPANAREPVAGVLRRTLVAPLMHLQKGAERWRAAYLSAERETLRRDTLALAAARVPALQTENDGLRRLLGLGAKLEWGFIPAEALQGGGRPDDFTITLSAGSNAKVAERSLVVSAEGVVGLVQTVDPTMSIAILFAHPDFRVSAMSADASAFGIVQPHVGTEAAESQAHLKSERYLLEMRGVPFRASLKPGAVIYSSGLGGIYPKGVPVGVVLTEIKTTEAWARTYLLRPAVNPTELTSVMILTPQRGVAGLTNIWADVGAIDSATRSIVVAGDSLARRAASAEAAARRLAIDSAARMLNDSVGRDTLQRNDSLARGAQLAPRPPAGPIDPAVSRARRDSVIARVRRDSVRRAQARAADTVSLQIPGAPPPPPPPPPEHAPDGDSR